MSASFGDWCGGREWALGVRWVAGGRLPLSSILSPGRGGPHWDWREGGGEIRSTPLRFAQDDVKGGELGWWGDWELALGERLVGRMGW